MAASNKMTKAQMWRRIMQLENLVGERDIDIQILSEIVSEYTYRSGVQTKLREENQRLADIIAAGNRETQYQMNILKGLK